VGGEKHWHHQNFAHSLFKAGTSASAEYCLHTVVEDEASSLFQLQGTLSLDCGTGHPLKIRTSH